MGGVQYIHDGGVVHCGLMAENLLFRTTAEDADIVIAGFGQSRVVEEENLLTDIYGSTTQGYTAPEIFKRSM
jgi:serine/threonine protein kinase